MTNFKEACENLFAAVAAFFRKYGDGPVSPRIYDHTKFDKWTQPGRPALQRQPDHDPTAGKEAYQDLLFR